VPGLDQCCSLDRTTGDDLAQDLMNRGLIACTARDACDLIVYHKEGVSTALYGERRGLTTFDQYSATHSLLAMTARFYWPWLPAMRARVIRTALKRFVSGNHRLTRAILLAVFDPELAKNLDRARKRFNEDVVSLQPKGD